MEEKRGEGTISIRIDGVRVLTILATRSQARTLRDVIERAKTRLAARSATGRHNDDDLIDLMTAAIDAESMTFLES